MQLKFPSKMNGKSVIMSNRLVIVVVILFVIVPSALEASSNNGLMTKALIDAWSEKLYSYKVKSGIFPNNEIGLLSLCDKQKHDCLERPKDVWQNEFIYIYPPKFGGKDFDLYSLGKNGIDEFGKGDDITNWSELSTIHYYPAKLIVALAGFVSILIVLFIFIFKLRRRPRGP